MIPCYDSEWVLLASVEATAPIEPGPHAANAVESSASRRRGPGTLKGSRLVDGGVTATGVLSRERGNLITIVNTH